MTSGTVCYSGLELNEAWVSQPGHSVEKIQQDRSRKRTNLVPSYLFVTNIEQCGHY